MGGRATEETSAIQLDACLPVVDAVVKRVAARSGLDGDETAELRSAVYLRLLEDDRAVLRRFSGRSSLSTYLTAVVHRLLLDRRAARWGKWRPSTAARRLGPLAEALEKAIYRDGLTLDEAVASLASARGPSRAELSELADALPPRSAGRPRESSEPLPYLESGEEVDARALDGERAAIARRAHALLRRLLRDLHPEDRRLLEMRFEDDLTVTEIAASLDVERRPLYLQLERCLEALGSELRRAGLTPAVVGDVLGWSGYPLHSDGRLRVG